MTGLGESPLGRAQLFERADQMERFGLLKELQRRSVCAPTPIGRHFSFQFL